MTDFKITERITKTRAVTCFIPYPDEEEGAGWAYTATSDGETISCDFLGRVRVKHLPTVIELLELAIANDANRLTEYGSVTFDFDTYEDEEEFRADVGENKLPVIGMVNDDFWIVNGISADTKQRSISTITLMRASNRYLLLEIGNPAIAFNVHELEGITALLKSFLPE